MSLSKEFFDRETNISAKVIADSVNENGVRITTLEVEAPRIILAEINTHNAISKNCSSTRAITLTKAIQQVLDNGFEPIYWGEKKSGMSAESEIGDTWFAGNQWNYAKKNAVESVKRLDGVNLHKQISGRLLEPFQMVKQVLTATDWDNFLNLRLHQDSQPEICMLAYKIYHAIAESTPNKLRGGEYHLPYVLTEKHCDGENVYSMFYCDKEVERTCEQVMTLDDAIKYSIARCASVSYRTESMTLEKSKEIYSRLLEADVLHSSPAEHIATPIRDEVCVIKGNDYVFADSEVDVVKSTNVLNDARTWQDGLTHMNRKGELCSANFRGWIQYRHMLKGNTCWDFDYNERMKSFEG